MKKRILLLTILLVVAFVCLAACDNFLSALQDITSLLKVDYSEVKLTITTTTNGFTLNGIYTLTFSGDVTTVDYSFERLNELSDTGANADDYKTTVEGTATVRDGVIVEGNVELPKEIDFGGISFKQAFFANYTMEGAVFEADVINPQGFTGNRTLQCTKMHVVVIHSSSAISKLSITYTSEGGSDVSINYWFTK